MKTNPLRPVTPALPGALVRSVLYAAGVCWLAASDFATAQTEPPDFSNASPGTAYNLVNGANVFSGTVTTPTDLQDNFQVICPAGKRITGVSKTASGGSFNGSVTFNAESLSGPGTANFTTGFPFSAGTYQVTVAADFSTGTNWSVTVTVADAPNYTVTTTATSITVTDDAGNGDTLDVTMPAAGQIRFAAAGRTFSVNGGALISGNSGNLSLSGISSRSRLTATGSTGKW